MSYPHQPQLPPQGNPAEGWHYPTAQPTGEYPVQPYQQPTQPYPYPYPPQQPYAQPCPPPYAQPYPPQPFVQAVVPQQHVQVNLYGGRPHVNHGLHLVLTLLTCGLWGLVWIVIAIGNS